MGVFHEKEGGRGEQGRGGKKHGETIADHISYVDAKFGPWQLLPKGATGL